MSNVAVLIDAENVLPIFAEQIMAQAESAGTLISKEIYGTAQALTSWAEPVLRYALHANLTIRASKWKNTSDIALSIGAMDLLMGGQVQTMIIVSSDSDFSALSIRLRFSGIEVIGIGTEKANPLWRTSCSSFCVLQPHSAPSQKATSSPAPSGKAAAAAQQPAQGAKAASPTKPAAQQPEPSKASSPATKSATAQSATATHHERVAVIQDYIAKQLEANHGRMNSNLLFQGLNTLPEYLADQPASRRKPINYLNWLFGKIFLFEEAPNGATWISLRAAEPMAEEDVKEKRKAKEKNPAETQDVEKTEPAPSVKASASESAEPEKTEAEEETPPAADKGTEIPTPAARKKSISPWMQAVRSAEAAISAAPAAPAPDLGAIPIQSIGLQPRPLNTLMNAGYRTLADLAALDEQELLAMKNIGVVTINQIKKAIQGAS